MGDVKPLKNPVQRRRELLAEMSAEQVHCRGFGHKWPSETISRKKTQGIPRGLESSAQADGCYQIREHCQNRCGRIRIWTTLRGGTFATDVQYRYEQDKSRPWVVVHDDEGVTLSGRDFKAEVWNDSGLPSLISAAARRSTA